MQERRVSHFSALTMFRDLNLIPPFRIRQGKTIPISHLDKFGDKLNYEVFMLIPSIPCEKSTSDCLKLTTSPENEIFLVTVMRLLGNPDNDAESDEEAGDVREDEENDKGGAFLSRMLKLGKTRIYRLSSALYYRPLLEEVFKRYMGLSDSRAEQMTFVKKRVLAVKQNVKVRTHGITFDCCLTQSMVCYMSIQSLKIIEDWFNQQYKARQSMKDEREDLCVNHDLYSLV